MVTGGPQHDYTHTEGGAVVCNYCNQILTFNFITRPARACYCDGYREAILEALRSPAGNTVDDLTVGPAPGDDPDGASVPSEEPGATPGTPLPFTTDHLIDHLRHEAQLVLDRGLVTRGQRLVIRDLLLRAAEEIDRLGSMS